MLLSTTENIVLAVVYAESEGDEDVLADLCGREYARSALNKLQELGFCRKLLCEEYNWTITDEGVQHLQQLFGDLE